MYKYLLTLFFIVTVITVNAQTVIHGKVVDAATGEELPYVSVFVKELGVGTPTNEKGAYTLSLKSAPDSISVSFIGYITQTKAVRKGDKRQVINFKLTPNTTALSEVLIRPFENPAWKIMRQVIAQKNANDKRALAAYQYEAYSTMQLSLENLSLKKNAEQDVPAIQVLSDSIASPELLQGKKVYPFFMSETLSDYFYNSDPERAKEVIKATKVVGIGLDDNEIFSELIGVSYRNHNFYQNWVPILNKNFISPIADGWKGSYEYDLLDSLYVDDIYCYKIKVTPKRAQDLAFKGYIWIEEDSYALRKIDVSITSTANINYVEGIHLMQELEPTEQGPWLPVKTEMTLHIAKLSKYLPNILARVSVSNKEVVIEKPRDASFFNKPTEHLTTATPLTETFWEENRHDSLSIHDQRVYAQIDSIKSLPQIKRYTEVMTMLIGGYKKVGKISIGPLHKTYAFNNIEGHRMQLGFRTNVDFSRHWELSAFTGYGTRDEMFKYGAKARYIISRENWTEVGVGHEKDLQQVGLMSDNLETTKLFQTFSRFNKLRRPILLEETFAYLQRDIFRGVTQRVSLKHKSFEPQYDFGYYQEGDGTNREITKDFATTELGYSIRIARKEVFVENGNTRLSLGKGRWPVFTAMYTLGLDNVLGATVGYQRLDLGVTQKLPTGRLGTAVYDLKGGKIFTPVPYPLLEVHRGNETPFYTRGTYNLMKTFEFASDTYASLYYEQQLEGLFLNSLPLVQKLKWRLLAHANILYGTMSQENQDMIAPIGINGATQDAFKTLGNTPYVEVGYSVDNIFKFLRVNFYHRLTHLDDPDTKRYGVKLSVHFKL